MTSKLIGIFSCPWGHLGAKQSWIKILYFYLALMTLSAKPLELISMVAPIGLFTLSSILTLTCIKWALETWKGFPKDISLQALKMKMGYTWFNNRKAYKYRMMINWMLSHEAIILTRQSKILNFLIHPLEKYWIFPYVKVQI
jgi:hypothetical protein